MTENKIILELKEDFVQRQTTATAMNALTELVWNALDSGSDNVDVYLETDELDNLTELRVIDYGSGIEYENVRTLFGNLGDSWKKTACKYKGRALHGKNGQGRLKAFSLGESVVWHTTYKKDDKFFSYHISGDLSSANSFVFTEPSEVFNRKTGTEVLVTRIKDGYGGLLAKGATLELLKKFAAYLSQYPTVQLNYDGTKLVPQDVQNDIQELELEAIELADGTVVKAKATVIEWNLKVDRAIHLCDASGISLSDVEPNIRTKDFNFTAYIKSDYFRELDKQNLLLMGETESTICEWVNQCREQVKAVFRKKLASSKSKVVERWKREKIYPYEDKKYLTPIEEAERQVFDIVAVNVENYLPKFSEGDFQTRKFTFQLLSQALKDNPDSVKRIISEVLRLKRSEQDELAVLMQKTSLSNIISTSKIVANRLDFLVGLENLLFDKSTKKKLLERDQLHKVLEEEAWIFDEAFALSGSEKRLEEVLELYLDKLGERKDKDESKEIINETDQKAPVLREGGKQGRIDLLLSRVIQPRNDEYDNLVVELKRPSQKITTEVLNQVESYAIAVAGDDRFHKNKTRWKFIAISNEFDEHAKRKATQRDRPEGLVFDDAKLNIEVWAYTWAEIISNARARLQFINKTLNYEADRESAKEYLIKAHEKFIPSDDDS